LPICIIWCFVVQTGMMTLIVATIEQNHKWSKVDRK